MSDGRPIHAHGLIGDLETAALVALDGCIDFLCWPSFDSPSVFASLLDPERGGHFSLQPVTDGARCRQMYLPDTNLLLTRFQYTEGVAEVSDFLTLEPGDPGQGLVRRIKAIRGTLRCRMECRPRFDYARTSHRASACGPQQVCFEPAGGETALRLTSSHALALEGDDAVVEFELGCGESVWFVLETANGQPSRFEQGHAVEAAFRHTMNFWHAWISRCNYDGRWREVVHRSALALKLMQSRRHGSFVAAPTFGLPEDPGGERNWDYRFTWIRDTSFTLYALLRLGFTEEARDYLTWLCGRLQGELPGQLSILYKLDGSPGGAEEILDHLRGYGNSRPIRVGNDAHDQLQLDIFGELMDAIYLCDKYVQHISHGLWARCVEMIDWVCDNWNQPDEGLWEVRGGRKHFLYSRVLCWVAIDRALRLSAKRSLPAPVERWRTQRDRLYREVHEDFWDPELGAFVQALGEKTLDASSLALPLLRFISPEDPRWHSHMQKLHDELVEDSLVLRYRTDAGHDGLEGDEGSFSLCSFWYVEATARAGDARQARLLFEKALGYANHLGLYAEELSHTGEHLGNFPQAFTHLALVSAAYELDRRLDAERGPAE